MERPSHIHFATRHFSHRLPLIGLAISFQATALWLFLHGFASPTLKIPEGPIELTPFDEPTMPPVKPPEPVLQPVQPVTAVEPLFNTPSEPARGNGLVTVMPQPGPTPVEPKPFGATQAPIGISATHSTPPYPPIARRMGYEGKVTLRLTVTAEGRVSEAEVVTSSGRDELDQTAQQWIVAHWIYKPALLNGVPAASHALATVTFSLANDR